MKQDMISFARKVKRVISPPKPSLTEVRLEKLAKSCDEYITKHQITPHTKIIWPTLFNQDQTWWGHDGMMIMALKLRGADVIPTMCDKLQADECMIHSGLWQKSFEPNFEERRKALCAQCVSYDLRLWDILNIRPIRLSSYITEGERVKIWAHVHELMQQDWENYVYEGYPVGKEIYKAVVNNHLQGDIKPSWRKEAVQMASHHAFNVLALMHVYKRVFENFSPDTVVGNGGYYYQWGVVHDLCQKLNIPYYRYYPIGLQPMAWNYALNSKEIVDLTPAWQSWLNQEWGEKHVEQVKQDLNLRGLRFDIDKDPLVKARVQAVASQLKLDPNKPTFLAFTGVIWDANTNVQSEAFDNMYLWLWDTIDWFSKRPEYQLIIRVHPAENIVPSVGSQERTKFEKELAQQGLTLSSNILIIKADEKIETYDVMHLVKAGAAYMSTTGLEFSCLGKPLITIGPVHYSKKGFTFEPKSKDAYFAFVEKLLSSEWSTQDQARHQELAMRYWYLYAFHASCVTGFFETHQANMLSVKRGIDGFSSYLKELTAEDLLPGKNEVIDYFCDSVLNHLPLMGENRWPPEVAQIHRKI